MRRTAISPIRLALQRLIRFLWSPLVVLSTRIITIAIFAVELPDTARKWWPIVIFLFLDVVMAIVDALRCVVRCLYDGCTKALTALKRLQQRLRSTTEHLDRIFDYRINNDEGSC